MSHTTRASNKLWLIHDGDLKGNALLCGFDNDGIPFEIRLDCADMVTLAENLLEDELHPIKEPMIVADRVGSVAHMEISQEAIPLLNLLSIDDAAAQAVVDTVNGLIDILAVDSAEEWKAQLEEVRARLGDKANPA